jgi:hypothetical protein
MNPIDLLNDSMIYYNKAFLGKLGDNGPKEFQTYPWSKEVEEGSKYLEMEKWRGNRRHRFLGSWIHPRTPRIHGETKTSPPRSPRAFHQVFLSVGKK